MPDQNQVDDLIKQYGGMIQTPPGGGAADDIIKQYGGTIAPADRPDRVTGQFGVEHPILAAPIDFLQGVGAGVMSTARGVSQLAHKLIPAIPEVPASFAETPDSNAAKAGKVAEQTAEFLAPTGIIGKTGKAVEAATAGVRGAKALNLAARMGLEATSAAGVTGLQTGGDPEAMKQAAETAGLTTGVLGAGAEGLTKLAPALKESALAQYNRVLAPGAKGTKYLAANQVAPGLLERDVSALSLRTLQGKAAAQVQKWGQAIGDAYANLPSGSAADLNSVTQRLDKMGEEFTILNPSTGELVPMGPQAQTAIKNIDRLKQSLTDIAQPNPQTGVLEVPVDSVRKLRQYFDNIAAKAGRYQGTTLADASAAEAHGLAADAIREELAQQFPDIAKINKEYSFWKNAQTVVDETVLRRTGQAKPLGRKLAGAAGAAGGFATGGVTGAIAGKKVMDALEQLTTSTAWGTVSAVNKNRLADALAKGSAAEVEFWVSRIANSISGAKTSQSWQDLPVDQRFDAVGRELLPGAGQQQDRAPITDFNR